MGRPAYTVEHRAITKNFSGGLEALNLAMNQLNLENEQAESVLKKAMALMKIAVGVSSIIRGIEGVIKGKALIEAARATALTAQHSLTPVGWGIIATAAITSLVVSATLSYYVSSVKLDSYDMKDMYQRDVATSKLGELTNG